MVQNKQTSLKKRNECLENEEEKKIYATDWSLQNMSLTKTKTRR